MTQNILVNSARGILKNKEHDLQPISWPAQSADLNLVEVVWDELNRKVRTKQLISAAHLWQILQESLAERSTSCFGVKNAENQSERRLKGIILMNQKF